MTYDIVIIPDLQAPMHSEPHVAALENYIKVTKPPMVASVGDEADFTGISKWAHGTALQFETNLHKEREATVSVLERLRITHMVRSNHTDRLYNTIKMRVPEFRHLPELTLERFLRLDDLGITYLKQPSEIAPGWILAHGDEGNLSQTGGVTALNLAKRFGKSVVCGHTHRAGLLHHTEAVAGKVTRTLWGLEVGHAMDMRKATYLKGGYGNWQQAFGMLRVDGKHVTPLLIPMRTDGSFVLDGKVWKAK